VAESQLLLLGLSPTIEGLRWQTGHRLRIGRQENLEIVVPEPSLSRLHAELRLTPQGWVVQDLGSASGTFLNGVAVGQRTRNLQAEDVLQCGRLTFKVRELEWGPLAGRSARPQDIKTSGRIVRVQALSQLSWEQGLRELALDNARLPHARQFLTLLRAGYHLSRIDSVSELLQSLLDDTVTALDAQRGAIVLLEETTGQLTLATASGPESGPGRRAFSQTLVQRCFSKGESLLCQDPQAKRPRAGGTNRDDMASIICALLRSPRRRLGILHLDRGPKQEPFSQEDFKLADAIAATVAVGIESAVAVDKQRTQFLQEVIELTQQTLALRDAATARHCQRVGRIALLLGEELHLSGSETRQLHLGALLHDLGTIGLPDGVLGKTGALEPHEEQQVRLHPLHGVSLAQKISGFAPALPIIRSHHECWDGTGYPDGLRGEQIPRLARVVAVADALDHLLTDRPGQEALRLDQALRRFQAEVGNRFDPRIVEALLGLGPRLEELFKPDPHASEASRRLQDPSA
jgi:HD-GYP domain-containing protein (c-di-GMP phosphodiesterase class II)